MFVKFSQIGDSDQLTDEDCRQIVSFIRRNLSVDDAVFRKQLNSSLLIILKHLSSLMGSKKKKKSAEPSKITPLATGEQS